MLETHLKNVWCQCSLRRSVNVWSGFASKKCVCGSCLCEALKERRSCDHSDVIFIWCPFERALSFRKWSWICEGFGYNALEIAQIVWLGWLGDSRFSQVFWLLYPGITTDALDHKSVVEDQSYEEVFELDLGFLVVIGSPLHFWCPGA